jgi:hypothetical protein
LITDKKKSEGERKRGGEDRAIISMEKDVSRSDFPLE